MPLKLFTVVVILLANAVAGCTRAERTDNSSPASNSEPSKSAVEPSPHDLPTDEQMAQWQRESFRPVIERWLKGERLPRHVDLDTKNPVAANSEHYASVVLLDVNGDGRKELAMQSGCAAVGNCVFWVFQKTGDGYTQLLIADMVQRFKLRKTRTNNYYDLETSSHDSANSGGIAVYKYNGSEYKIAECFGYEYELTGKMINGQSVTRDTPTLTPADCSKWPGVDTPQ